MGKVDDREGKKEKKKRKEKREKNGENSDPLTSLPVAACANYKRSLNKIFIEGKVLWVCILVYRINLMEKLPLMEYEHL